MSKDENSIIKMEDKILKLESVAEIIERNFFIPDYQRGYRWVEQQVEHLLNDITNFSPIQIDNSTDKTWYCLQPLVVKECDENKKKINNLDSTKTWFEVIDGQQRLTTVFLIIHYINEMWRGRDKDSEMQIKYKTREKSNNFLSQIKINSNNDVDIIESNIDFYHISTAYKTIHNWVKNKKNKKFIKDNFIDKIINNTKFIWYETNEKDSIKIFTRINSGKIPLTNAELIKALFLNSSNFELNEVYLKQLQIAYEWDRIEYELQEDSFWFFINEKKNEIDTRIEFIFDLMAKKPDNNENEFFTFEKFSRKFITNTKKEITQNWNESKRCFQTMEEWYSDRELYHKIGFLITSGEKIGVLKDLSNNCTKKDFKDKIHALIASKVNVQIDQIEYRKPEVKRVLLLHNIQTMLDNISEDSRFPFDRYKKNNWDIEHINSVAEKMPSTELHQQDFLKESVPYIKDLKLKQRASYYIKSEFETLFKDIIAYFNDTKDEEEKDSISNLVLLDYKTNRGYGNAVYPVKRNTIISNDKSGTFIPICTKNVFMKYYSPNIEQMTFWGLKERIDYLNDIKRVLNNSKYLPNQNNEINDEQ